MQEPVGKGQKRGRGRPVAFDRDAAVRAAMDEFWKRGFEGVSISDLADAMGIRRSSFYNSFGDREGVFREALDLYRGLAPDGALTRLKPGQPVLPVIREVFREICRVRAADPEARGCLVVNSIAELAGHEGDPGATVRAVMAEAEQMYRAMLAQALRQGEIAAPAEPEVLVRAILTFVIGLNTVSKALRDEAALWALCEDFLARYGLVSTA